MRRRHLYLRLLEEEESRLSDEQRVASLKAAVEMIGDVEWVSLPTLHGRGGLWIKIDIAVGSEDIWSLRLRDAGYLACI